MATTITGSGITTGDVSVTAQSTDIATTGDITAVDATLSGGVYLGGTGAANYLDDYERGTWTPVFAVEGSGNCGMTNQSGHYTRVGNIVICTAQLAITSVPSPGSAKAWEFHGLPFQADDNGYRAGSVMFQSASFNYTTYFFGGEVFNGQTYGRIYASSNGTSMPNSSNAIATSTYRFTVTYRANA